MCVWPSDRRSALTVEHSQTFDDDELEHSVQVCRDVQRQQSKRRETERYLHCVQPVTVYSLLISHKSLVAVQFITRTSLRYVRVSAVTILSLVCLSSVLLVHLTQGVEAFGNISLSLCGPWPSSVLRAKFYKDRSDGMVAYRPIVSHFQPCCHNQRIETRRRTVIGCRPQRNVFKASIRVHFRSRPENRELR